MDKIGRIFRVWDPVRLLAVVLPLVPVISLKPLKDASELVRCYKSVSIELTATKICLPVIENYEIQRKAIYLRTKQTLLDVPKIGNTTIVAKWNDSIIVYAG